MNYEPNDRHWKPGDLVIHDADAKSADMLMRVLRFTPDGLIETEYVNEDRRREWLRRNKNRPQLANEPKYLHDPARFDIALPAVELPTWPNIGCSHECGFVKRGIGWQCLEGTACGKYLHPGDIHFDPVDAYYRAHIAAQC